MKKLFLLIVCALPLILFSCTQQQKSFDSASAQKAIDEGNAAFSSYFAKGDSTSMAALYTEDAKVLPPNMKMVNGQDEIESLWGSFIRLGQVNIQLATTSLTGSGNIAVETGSYNLKVQPQGTDAIQDQGKYMVVWQLQSDNSWKMIRDMWSSDLPAASN